MKRLQAFKEEYRRRKKEYDEKFDVKQRRLFEFFSRNKKTLVKIFSFVISGLLALIYVPVILVFSSVFVPSAGVWTKVFSIIFVYLVGAGFCWYELEKMLLHQERMKKIYNPEVQVHCRNNERIARNDRIMRDRMEADVDRKKHEKIK